MSGKRGGKGHHRQKQLRHNPPLIPPKPNNVQRTEKPSGKLLISTEIQSSTLTVTTSNKVWPDLPQCQSALFYECTLFLYSILALFLQYLNLYKTLWWLPKSHWHYSMKLHMINPYLLSVIGLMLGIRVTKCFWNSITERMLYFSKDHDGWQLVVWRVLEYALIKTPLMAVVFSSFLFSFSRVFVEFRVKAICYFVYPMGVYALLFWKFIKRQYRYVKKELLGAWRKRHSVEDVLDAVAELSWSPLVDMESMALSCGSTSTKIGKNCDVQKSEVLLEDCETRFKFCIFTGLVTAYYAIFVPRAFVPDKTIRGQSQYMLIDDIWVTELCIVVALTAFSVYVTYLFPLQYLDLMCRYASRLGCWEKLEEPVLTEINAANAKEVQKYDGEKTFVNGDIVTHKDITYRAHSHKEQKSVLAVPGNEEHARFFHIAKNPVKLSTYICVFQALLVALQFWLLILTTDWQHIVTLVLLMFANYLLLAKMFKDRVVIGRIFHPSAEDVQLIRQLQRELRQKQSAK